MILIVASKFDKSGDNLVNDLISNCTSELIKNNHILEDNIQIIRVPGANEITNTIQHFITKYPNKFSIAIAIGLIIKGDTDHYEMVRDSSTMGITQLSIQKNIPIIQGILACHTKEQAIERKHLGREFAQTALEIIDMKKL
jgi:6,7-dimethyl-8-ribityllumazine synthase